MRLADLMHFDKSEREPEGPKWYDEDHEMFGCRIEKGKDGAWITTPPNGACPMHHATRKHAWDWAKTFCHTWEGRR